MQPLEWQRDCKAKFTHGAATLVTSQNIRPKLELSTANYYARLSMNVVLGVERLPFLQGRAPRWKSGGPSPRDGSVLRRRSELPSRDRAPALIGLSSAQPALSFPDRHVIV